MVVNRGIRATSFEWRRGSFFSPFLRFGWNLSGALVGIDGHWGRLTRKTAYGDRMRVNGGSL